MDEEDIRDILNDNPFIKDDPTPYEQWNHAAIMMVFSNIAGLTKAIESLGVRLQEHERLHNAANAAAMDLPSTEDKGSVH